MRFERIINTNVTTRLNQTKYFSSQKIHLNQYLDTH
jgi:hypothetical protein